MSEELNANSIVHANILVYTTLATRRRVNQDKLMRWIRKGKGKKRLSKDQSDGGDVPRRAEKSTSPFLLFYYLKFLILKLLSGRRVSSPSPSPSLSLDVAFILDQRRNSEPIPECKCKPFLIRYEHVDNNLCQLLSLQVQLRSLKSMTIHLT